MNEEQPVDYFVGASRLEMFAWAVCFGGLAAFGLLGAKDTLYSAYLHGHAALFPPLPLPTLGEIPVVETPPIAVNQ